jgi:hypothetical protein
MTTGITRLLTPKEAAARLRCSLHMLAEYVVSGELAYVPVGRGEHRPRRMYREQDVEDFIARKVRKDEPPLGRPAATNARRSAPTNPSSKVVGFTALRNAREAERRKTKKN